MSAAPDHLDRPERRRMSLDEFLALPDEIRAEYVDGEALMSPPASIPHNHVAFRLARVLDDDLDGLLVVLESGVHTSERRYRVPDIVVLPEMEGGVWAEQTPVLLVEVLSPSTRAEDTLRKSAEYASAGVDQYWIVDREHRTLTVLGNNGSGWDLLLELGEGEQSGDVRVGDHGTVSVDLVGLLGT